MPERPLCLDTADPLLQIISEAQQQRVSSFSGHDMDGQQELQDQVAALEAAAKEREAELHSAKQDVEGLQVPGTCSRL